MLRTKSVCPEKVRTSVPAAASQIFAVLSLLPVRNFVPSGEKATDEASALALGRARRRW